MSTATRRSSSGIPIQDVYSAIQAQFGSLTVSQYNLFSNVWWVVCSRTRSFRQNRRT
jgi:multidrug efflux pump